MAAGEECAKGFEGRHDNSRKAPPRRPGGEGGPSRRLWKRARFLASMGKSFGPKAAGEGPSGRMDGGRFAPDKTMPKSKRLCRAVRTNGANIPYVKGKYIGCVSVVHTASKQEVKKCNSTVIDVNFTQTPQSILDTIATSTLALGGNENDAGERDAVKTKIREVVNLTDAMRAEPSGENNMLRRLLTDLNLVEEE